MKAFSCTNVFSTFILKKMYKVNRNKYFLFFITVFFLPNVLISAVHKITFLFFTVYFIHEGKKVIQYV